MRLISDENRWHDERGRDTDSELIAENKTLRFELLMVAKLAADSPQFYNALDVGHAKHIRDRVLRNADEYV